MLTLRHTLCTSFDLNGFDSLWIASMSEKNSLESRFSNRIWEQSYNWHFKKKQGWEQRQFENN